MAKDLRKGGLLAEFGQDWTNVENSAFRVVGRTAFEVAFVVQGFHGKLKRLFKVQSPIKSVRGTYCLATQPRLFKVSPKSELRISSKLLVSVNLIFVTDKTTSSTSSNFSFAYNKVCRAS